jgi:hypothetical protein
MTGGRPALTVQPISIVIADTPSLPCATPVFLHPYLQSSIDRCAAFHRFYYYTQA